MILGGGIIGAGSGGGINVQLPAYGNFDNIDSSAVVFSGIRFGSDGLIYRNTVDGSWQSTGLQWLNDGAASLYWLKRATSGDALVGDAGNLQQMSANLDFHIVANFGDASNDTNIDCTICSDSGGVTELVARTYSLSATKF